MRQCCTGTTREWGRSRQLPALEAVPEPNAVIVATLSSPNASGSTPQALRGARRLARRSHAVGQPHDGLEPLWGGGGGRCSGFVLFWLLSCAGQDRARQVTRDWAYPHLHSTASAVILTSPFLRRSPTAVASDERGARCFFLAFFLFVLLISCFSFFFGGLGVGGWDWTCVHCAGLRMPHRDLGILALGLALSISHIFPSPPPPHAPFC